MWSLSQLIFLITCVVTCLCLHSPLTTELAQTNHICLVSPVESKDGGVLFRICNISDDSFVALLSTKSAHRVNTLLYIKVWCLEKLDSWRKCLVLALLLWWSRPGKTMRHYDLPERDDSQKVQLFQLTPQYVISISLNNSIGIMIIYILQTLLLLFRS